MLEHELTKLLTNVEIYLKFDASIFITKIDRAEKVPVDIILVNVLF